MADCIFCKIRDGQIGADIIHEDDDAIAFRDLNPQAPLHALIVPRRHIATINDLVPDDDALVGRLFRIAAKLAADAGFGASGYRTVFNCGQHAGQTVFHIHLHVLGGRHLGWPPG